MKRSWLIGAAAVAFCSTLVVAQDAPESLLPPGFDDPAPTPPTPPEPAQTSAPAAPVAPATPGNTATPVIQPVPGVPESLEGWPDGLPSIEELEELDVDELDELLGLKPKYDIPPAARRALSRVGVISEAEGGLPATSLANQPASIVRAALSGIQRPLVSRWGHILLRRSLASRLATPQGMNPVEFAALRTQALNSLGEHSVAQAIAQDIDTGNWNDRLTNAAIDAFVGTGDIVGACPITQIRGGARQDARWQLLQNICYAFAGQGARSQNNLNRVFGNRIAPEIDVLLAQRYAGAAGRGRRAINLEWGEVEELTPWRFALANAVGAEIPEALLSNPADYYRNVAATTPALALERRVDGADVAGRRGVLSSQAMVDLYSQVAARRTNEGASALTASRLRDAYTASDPVARVEAIRDVWSGTDTNYSRYVLTAYAAARVTPSAELSEDAAELITSMLTAGLDADALSWAPFVGQGSQAWAQLALAQPIRANPVTEEQMTSFIEQDESQEQRKSKFLLAGMAGLGRIDSAAVSGLAQGLTVNLDRETKWSQTISSAATAGNSTLVSFLAGLGMQGSGWDKMTPRHLYHIVAALNRVGLTAEARMIAAEAIARG